MDLNQLQQKYDLELNEIVKNIRKNKAKLVLLQFPDGLKQYATKIADYLKGKVEKKTEFIIWLDSCYGACDLPVGLEKLNPKIDLVIQFGHNSLMPNP